MLNKTEKGLVCAQIAEWEWNNASTSSGASEVAHCADQLRRLFNIERDDPDYTWAIAWRIAELAGQFHSDAREEEFLYILSDMVETDYENVKDLTEIGRNFEGLVAAVKERM